MDNISNIEKIYNIVSNNMTIIKNNQFLMNIIKENPLYMETDDNILEVLTIILVIKLYL